MTRMLTRWNPVREMTTMQRAMDRLFDDWRPFFDFDGESTEGTRALALDVHEDDNNYVLTTEMPGVQPDQIQVRKEGDYLVIEGELSEEKSEKEGTRTLVSERRYGRYMRRIRLPQDIDADKAEAQYENGVLTLKLPKAEVVKPKLIPIKVGK
ncbi:MAG: Hsp20/alpha crystallin family protein [Anaerolineae bacterium]|nr:Hsp20/alpha crystallin family protein [Anaerolineae bacterium]